MAKRKTISGDEVDVTEHRRHLLYFQRPGVTAEIKRRMTRRERQEGKREARNF